MCVLLTPISLFSKGEVHSQDPRAYAMGGIGVSSADYLSAPFHNPALIAIFNEDDSAGLMLPAAGRQVIDKGNIVDDAQDVVRSVVSLINDISLDNANNVIESIRQLQGDTAFIQYSYGFSAAMPNQTLSVNVFGKYYQEVFILTDLSENDFSVTNIIDNRGRLESRVNTIGVDLMEVGISMAKSFDRGFGKFLMGFSPKIQRVDSINYVVNLDSYIYGDFQTGDYDKQYTRFNTDIGLAIALKNGWRFGLSGRNVIRQEYDFKEVLGVSGKYLINPIFTTSVSYNSDKLTLGIDIDLTENQRFDALSGTRNVIDPELDNTRMMGLGIEIDPWGWIKLRGGVQTDINQNIKNQITLGAAWTPFNLLHFDLSGSYGGRQQYGVAGKFSFQF